MQKIQTKPGRIKARSKRGWTAPTPAQLARQHAAKAEADRKAAKELQRQTNIAQHQEWLVAQAKMLPEAAVFDWLAQHAASPSEVTTIADRLARGV